MKTEEIAARINRMQPGRDWHMECQALVYWAGVAISGSDKRWTYGRAIWAYENSHIESLDPLAAPAGAIHYWLYPSGHGHVGIELGDGRVLMSGTPHELGKNHWLLGNNYGVTTVAVFMSRGTQEYLGWSTTNGTNEPLTPYFDQGDEDMTPEQSAKLDAIYDAIFTEKRTSRGTRGGILKTLAAIDDSLFFTKTTFAGTPGGVLVTLRKVTDKLGITKPDSEDAEK